MPELPEVEITARRLSRAAAGATIESALAPGMVTMKTFDPPLDAIAGTTVAGVRRVGKMLVVDTGELVVLIHLMSAGRLQLWDKRASLRDRASRLLIRLEDGRELRLREFGTQQRAWAKLLPAEALSADEAVATLGPDAYPAPSAEDFRLILQAPRHLHPLLRDQRTIAGIGRGYSDDILHEAKLSPTAQLAKLERSARVALVDAVHWILDDALVAERRRSGGLPTKLGDHFTVHGKSGTPCPRCGADLRRVSYEEYEITYCPDCQTGGRRLNDRRIDRLLR
jgi:formamidopyrimidine-DNA glycosylase